MGDYTSKVTETDFAIALKGAKMHSDALGLSFTEELRMFLIHQSEVIASKEAEIRYLYNILHPKGVKDVR